MDLVSELNYFLFHRFGFKISKKASSIEEIKKQILLNGFEFNYFKISIDENFNIHQIPNLFFTTLFIDGVEIYGEIKISSKSVVFRNKYSSRILSSGEFEKWWSGNILYFGEDIKLKNLIQPFIGFFRKDYLFMLIIFLISIKLNYIFTILFVLSSLYYEVIKNIVNVENSSETKDKFCKAYQKCELTKNYIIYRNVSFSDISFLHAIFYCLTIITSIFFIPDLNFILLTYLIIGSLSFPFLVFSFIYQLKFGFCRKCMFVLIVNILILLSVIIWVYQDHLKFNWSYLFFWIFLIIWSITIFLFFKKNIKQRSEKENLFLENFNILRTLEGHYLEFFLSNQKLILSPELQSIQNSRFNIIQKKLILVSDIECPKCKEYLKWILPIIKRQKIDLFFLLRKPNYDKHYITAASLMNDYLNLPLDEYLYKLELFSNNSSLYTNSQHLDDKFLRISQKCIEGNQINSFPTLFIDFKKVKAVHSKEMMTRILNEYLT